RRRRRNALSHLRLRLRIERSIIMDALRLESPKTFRQANLPEPDAPGSSEALVRVHRVGICGTDISAYLGKMPFVTYPRILGHELGVEVIAVGDSVTNVKPGDRCSVEPDRKSTRLNSSH